MNLNSIRNNEAWWQIRLEFSLTDATVFSLPHLYPCMFHIPCSISFLNSFIYAFILSLIELLLYAEHCTAEANTKRNVAHSPRSAKSFVETWHTEQEHTLQCAECCNKGIRLRHRTREWHPWSSGTVLFQGLGTLWELNKYLFNERMNEITFELDFKDCLPMSFKEQLKVFSLPTLK